MFERLEVLSGDLDKGIWAIDKNCITHYGNALTSRKIQYSDIQVLTKTEQISNVVYIEIKLITGETANAKLDVKYYSILYDNYTKAKPSSVGVDSSCSNDLKFIDNGHDKENALDLWSGKPSSKINNGITKVSSNQSNEQHPVKERSTENLLGWLVGIILLPFILGIGKGDNSEGVESILDLSSPQKATICKQYIGSLTGRNRSIMSEYQEGDKYTSYIRYRADNDYWSFACTFTNKSIVWSGWLMRDTPPKWGRTRFEDEAVITYDNASKVISIEGHGYVSL